MPKASTLVLATDREIRAAVSPSARTDFRIKGAPGLQLRVTERSSKTWALAYRSPLTGKWTKFAIGSYPAVSLAEAKARAQELAVNVRKGVDPVHDKRRQAHLENFESLSKLYMREHETRNARAGKRSRSTDDAQRILDRDILLKLGSIKAELIRRHHIMQVVDAVADRGALVAADRALGLVRAIFRWACGSGRLEHDPTIGLKRRAASKPKSRVLNDDEIKIFWQASEDMPGMGKDIRDALRLQLLTGTRINEVVEAARDEIDWNARLWTIPAARTKSGREHQLPLSDFALKILRDVIARADLQGELRARRTGVTCDQSPWLFPSRRSVSSLLKRTKPLKRQRRRTETLEPHAATRCLVRLREDFRAAGIKQSFNTHDLRRTTATKLGELSIPEEIIERILNHAPRTVTLKHYNHARYMSPMREAMEAWSHRLQCIIDASAGTENQEPQNFLAL